jgi:hypothetical protein
MRTRRSVAARRRNCAVWPRTKGRAAAPGGGSARLRRLDAQEADERRIVLLNRHDVDDAQLAAVSPVQMISPGSMSTA